MRHRYIGPLPERRRDRNGCQVCSGPRFALVLLRRELGGGTICRALCEAHARQAELSPRYVGIAGQENVA